MDLNKKKFSFIYHNIFIYRIVMNLLYLGGYKKRFNYIIDILISNKFKIVTELCFGDILLAKWCKENQIEWNGFDVNRNFILNAKKKGYNAKYRDLLKFENLPKSDVIIIIGSLYHFHDSLEKLIQCIMNSTSSLIISEPISNLSSNNSIIGKIAKKLTKSGNGNEEFRYDYNSLYKSLNKICKGKYKISELNKTHKDLILNINKIQA